MYSCKSMFTTVLIFEDNDHLRDSLSVMISSNAQFVLLGAFADATKAAEQVRELNPQVILMDINMPGINGIEAVKEIRLSNADTHIIMLTIFEDNQHIYDAICAGASGYLLKKNIPDRLIDSIGEVLAGGAPMSPSVARIVVRQMQKPVTNNNAYGLTDRESGVLLLLSKGNSYKLIAAESNISIDTVRSHIKKIYEKLQVHSQTEAVIKAIHENLL